MEFIRLFEPLIIKGLRIPNRIAMPAMGLHFSKGFVFTKRYQNFYRERALGGLFRDDSSAGPLK
jgi:2,4-dienoyl-CoA reductase-like NADH-dependent reductase (Old Yellow Enzyme family)